MITSGSAIRLQNSKSDCAKTSANSEDAGKFHSKDSAYQEYVLKDKLDKHYAQCVACEIRLFFVPYCCDCPYKI